MADIECELDQSQRIVSARHVAMLSILNDPDLTRDQLHTRLKDLEKIKSDNGFVFHGGATESKSTQAFLIPTYVQVEKDTGQLRLSETTKQDWQVYLGDIYNAQEQQRILQITESIPEVQDDRADEPKRSAKQTHRAIMRRIIRKRHER